MAKSTCSLPECDKPRDYLGLCPMHAARLKRNGDPRVAKRPWRTDNPERAARRGHWAAHKAHQGRPCELESYGFCSAAIVVHHVNEDPTDNRPENLRVLCNRHHILHHKGDFDLDNPDHSRYYITRRGTLRRRLAA